MSTAATPQLEYCGTATWMCLRKYTFGPWNRIYQTHDHMHTNENRVLVCRRLFDCQWKLHLISRSTASQILFNSTTTVPILLRSFYDVRWPQHNRIIVINRTKSIRISSNIGRENWKFMSAFSFAKLVNVANCRWSPCPCTSLCGHKCLARTS